MTRLVALIASHNRRDRTLACLTALFDQDVSDVDVEAVLVDDGSTDGTADAAESSRTRSRCSAETGRSTGRGRWRSRRSRASRGRPEYLLWLNEDVVLERRRSADATPGT